MVTQRPGRPGKVLVTFSLPAAIWANTIHLIGDFNGWNSQLTALHLDDRHWKTELELDAGQTYYYAYLIDGIDWISELQSPAQLGRAQSTTSAVLISVAPEQVPSYSIEPEVVSRVAA